MAETAESRKPPPPMLTPISLLRPTLRNTIPNVLTPTKPIPLRILKATMSASSRRASVSPPSDSQHQLEQPAPKRPRLTSPARDIELEERRRKLDYSNGVFLAPMVRIGTLTTRLLALDYGADLVWGPEIVDRAIIGSKRVVNEQSGAIEYQKNGPKAIWETHPIEKPRLIYQIGSSDPDLALQAARTIQQDVVGVDLNCGCPKPFSVKGGMGAALLSDPAKLCSILKNLVDNLPHLSVSCKIRLLPTSEATLSLVSQILDTGIKCLTVHCRTQSMRSTEPALHERLKEVVELVGGRVPVVANGDAYGWKDVESIKGLTGVTSVMIARGAEENPSCFARSGMSDPESVVIPKFVRVAEAVGQNFGNAKYCIAAINLKSSRPTLHTPSDRQSRKSAKEKINGAKDYAALKNAFRVAEMEGAGERVENLLPGLVGLEGRWLEKEVVVAEGEKEVVARKRDDDAPAPSVVSEASDTPLPSGVAIAV